MQYSEKGETAGLENKSMVAMVGSGGLGWSRKKLQEENFGGDREISLHHDFKRGCLTLYLSKPTGLYGQE